MLWKRFKESFWFELTALTVISIFVYLIHIREFSYYRDDWYYMYDGLVGGGRAFVEMFRHLRPIRGPLFDLLFGLFGTNPMPYHILLYLWRLIGGFGAFWLFHILWPKQRTATFFMALTFLIYPGFLWWVQGFEYQPMVLSVGLQIFSIVFTLKAVQATSQRVRSSWMIAALLTGWSYLAFVEYAIGMEALRWLCLYLLLAQNTEGALLQKVMHTVKTAWVFLLIPALFLFWRIFLFDNERKAADIGLQAAAVLNSPGTALWWLIHFLQSVLNVSIFAWVSPFNTNFYVLRLKDILFVVVLAGIVLAITYAIQRFTHADEELDPPRIWQLEAVSIGILGVSAGVLPIIVANRVVSFERFSHYALPASLAATPLVIGLICLLTDRRVRAAVLAVLVGLSTLTHGAVAANAIDEEQLVQKFWHQVAWRVPDLRPGTVLLVNYANMDYNEGTDIVWGPANFIYYPEPQEQIPLNIQLVAARMEADTPKNILEGAKLNQNYIIINTMQYDFDHLLVISMPTTDSCVHVYDGNWAEISISDPALIGLAAPRSRIDFVDVNAVPHTPQVNVFGEEPPHDTWCYYYQKAQLARQMSDWQTVSEIGEEAAKLGLHPNDQIEWMPFLQAAVVSGDEKLARQISTKINTEQLYKKQACDNLNKMELTPVMQVEVNELFCGG